MLMALFPTFLCFILIFFSLFFDEGVAWIVCKAHSTCFTLQWHHICPSRANFKRDMTLLYLPLNVLLWFYWLLQKQLSKWPQLDFKLTVKGLQMLFTILALIFGCTLCPTPRLGALKLCEWSLAKANYASRFQRSIPYIQKRRKRKTFNHRRLCQRLINSNKNRTVKNMITRIY